MAQRVPAAAAAGLNGGLGSSSLHDKDPSGGVGSPLLAGSKSSSSGSRQHQALYVGAPGSGAGSSGGGSRPAHGHHRQAQQLHHSRLSQWLLLLLCTAVVAFVASSRSLHSARLSAVAPIQPHADVAPLPPGVHVAHERMLRMLVEECAKGEDSVISVDPEGSMLVQSEVDPSHCPLMDIMLRGSERGIGMCGDAALYALHLGARLVAPSDLAAYDGYCGATTARLFLETMYEGFISRRPGVLHLQLLNAEHMWARDAPLHRKMNAFLCKTVMCETLVSKYVRKAGFHASVWLMGHTSNDPTVDLPPAVKQHAEPSFLHVKGKSGLKHTIQLLECWRSRPDLPRLTVIGRFSWEEVKASVGSPNIVVVPKVTHAHNQTQTEHVSFQQIRVMQAKTPIHFCASEREGFGHYLNEARAAGALVITTDHPPMNELITPATGILIPPARTSSYPEMALAPFAAINAILNASQLCDAADAALRLPAAEVARRGALARAAYLQEDAAFLARVKDLRSYLKSHAEARQVTAPRGSFWQQQLRRQQPWRRRLLGSQSGSGVGSSSGTPAAAAAAHETGD